MTSIDNIYKTFQTIKEMLKDRKIDISAIENFQIPELKALLKQNSTSMIIVLDVNESFRILYSLSKFKFQDLKKYLTKKDLKHVMVITKEKLSTTNFKSFDTEENNEIDFEYFIIKELMFNISKHELVPLHEILRDEKMISDIIEIHKIKSKAQFPLITKEDPMARYLNAKPGNLLRITRNSPTSGIYYIYRYCI